MFFVDGCRPVKIKTVKSFCNARHCKDGGFASWTYGTIEGFSTTSQGIVESSSLNMFVDMVPSDHCLNTEPLRVSASRSAVINGGVVNHTH